MQGSHSNAATPVKMPAIGRIGWLRGALGAGLAIALTGLASYLALRGDPAMPWLLAPMGASAVLIFVLPASPLSQPWPVLGGHLIAALVGMLAHGVSPMLGAAPWLAAALAVGGAIAAMSMARCLHPPAGGTALITALPGPSIVAAGWHFLLMPLTLNVVLMLACGAVWNRLTGHSYPHRAQGAPVIANWVGHIEDADLDAVLEEWDEVLDVSRDDLLALVHAIEARVRNRFRG
ncbi:MAG: hypothetical protein RLZZ84_1111 [Pseudomonadota bacterium]|jgi:CBS domain-containing membrane protein